VEKIEDEDFLHCLRGENLSCLEHSSTERVGLLVVVKTLARSILFPLFLALHRAPVGVYTLSTVLSPIEHRSLELFFSVDLTLQWLDLQPSSTVEPTDPAR
jgi:hypothetical protein